MKKFEDPSLLHALFFIILGAYLFVFFYFQDNSLSLGNPINFWFTPLIFGPFILKILAKILKLRFFVAALEGLELWFILPYLVIGIGFATILIDIFKISDNKLRVKLRWVITYGFSLVVSVSSSIMAEIEHGNILIIVIVLLGLLGTLSLVGRSEEIGHDGLLYSKENV